MTFSLRIAVRDWDWFTPLLLGEVDLRELDRLGVELEVVRVQTLPDLPTSEEYGGAEMSLSRYVSHVAAGGHAVVALPHCLMQSFRHRCIVVPRRSSIHSVRELRGGTIGLTGWQDSGNTWTRAVLAESGVGIGDAHWVVGRLTERHPIEDRLGGHGVPGRIEADAQERPLTDLLAAGELDAVLTPFMPTGFFSVDSPWRPLLDDVTGAEASYADRHGFVPGIHVLAFKEDLVRERPEVAGAISSAFAESRRIWTAKRRRYAETSMWLISDLLREARSLPAGWDLPGLEYQGPMFAAFAEQMVTQGLLAQSPTIDQLFPIDLAAEVLA